jgi:predicted PurR-regulated permease PerM
MKKIFNILKSPDTLANLLVVLAGVLFYMLLKNIAAVGSAAVWIFHVLWPLILGLILAYLVSPLSDFLSRKVFGGLRSKKAAQVIGVVSAYLLLLILTGLIVWAIVPQLISSGQLLVGNMEGYFNQSKDFLMRLKERYDFLNIDIDALVGSWSELFANVSNWLLNNFLGLVNASYTLGTKIVNFSLGLVISVYILLDKENIRRISARLRYSLSGEMSFARQNAFLTRCNGIFKSYIVGSILDSLIVGIATFLFMIIMGMPYPLLISTIAALTNIIPTFGPIIGAAPCIFVFLLINPVDAFWYLIWVAVIQTVDANVIKPLLFSDSTGLRPLSVLLAIVIGGRLFGLVGMLVGIPVFALLSEMVAGSIDRRLCAKGYDFKADPAGIVVRKKEPKKKTPKK